MRRVPRVRGADRQSRTRWDLRLAVLLLHSMGSRTRVGAGQRGCWAHTGQVGLSGLIGRLGVVLRRQSPG